MKLGRLLLFLVTAFVGACSAIQLTPAGAKVEIVFVAPTHCTLLGKVTGSQGNWLTGDYSSEDSMLSGAGNDARNRAAALGGNVIYILPVDGPVSEVHAGADSVTVYGEAYRCE